jgi:hypothetical protein
MFLFRFPKVLAPPRILFRSTGQWRYSTRANLPCPHFSGNIRPLRTYCRAWRGDSRAFPLRTPPVSRECSGVPAPAGDLHHPKAEVTVSGHWHIHRFFPADFRPWSEPMGGAPCFAASPSARRQVCMSRGVWSAVGHGWRPDRRSLKSFYHLAVAATDKTFRPAGSRRCSDHRGKAKDRQGSTQCGTSRHAWLKEPCSLHRIPTRRFRLNTPGGYGAGGAVAFHSKGSITLGPAT